ncbi:MAG: hypothetical protein J6T10_24555 [Methanobrevibacter sp.]|nr:hypothetical protein [Methanobrevibacter sp.]
MIDINVGEYVRTTQGYIAKVERIDDTFIWFDGAIWFDCYEECYELSIKNELGLYDQSNEIINHSFNIIDLIEVGDYVNGHLVIEEFAGEDNELCFTIEYGKNCIKYLNERHPERIKTIVTKEKFKAREYKVGDDEQ